MNPLELIFSVLIILIPVLGFFSRRSFNYFPILLSGANPYVAALTLVFIMVTNISVFFKKYHRDILNISLIWISYGIFIMIFNFNSTAINETIQIGIGLIFCNFIYNSINKFSDYKILSLFMIASGLVIIFFEIFIYLFQLELISTALIDSNPRTYTSIYLVTSLIPFCLIFIRSTLIKLVLISLALFVTQINESRFASLLILTLTFIYFFRSSSSNLRIFSIVMISILIYILSQFYFDYFFYNNQSFISLLNFENNFSNLERVRLISYAYDLFIENPFGYGVGSSAEIFRINNVTVGDNYPHPHNTLVFLGIELGIIGILIYFYLFFAIFRSVFKLKNIRLKNLGILLAASLLFSSFANTLFFNGALSLFSFLIISMILLLNKIERSVKN